MLTNMDFFTCQLRFLENVGTYSMHGALSFLVAICWGPLICIWKLQMGRKSIIKRFVSGTTHVLEYREAIYNRQEFFTKWNIS